MLLALGFAYLLLGCCSAACLLLKLADCCSLLGCCLLTASLTAGCWLAGSFCCSQLTSSRPLCTSQVEMVDDEENDEGHGGEDDVQREAEEEAAGTTSMPPPPSRAHASASGSSRSSGSVSGVPSTASAASPSSEPEGMSSRQLAAMAGAAAGAAAAAAMGAAASEPLPRLPHTLTALSDAQSREAAERLATSSEEAEASVIKAAGSSTAELANLYMEGYLVHSYLERTVAEEVHMAALNTVPPSSPLLPSSLSLTPSTSLSPHPPHIPFRPSLLKIPSRARWIRCFSPHTPHHLTPHHVPTCPSPCLCIPFSPPSPLLPSRSLPSLLSSVSLLSKLLSTVDPRSDGSVANLERPCRTSLHRRV